MAADEALLQAAGAGSASFRLYGWQTATLSLGYFQAAAVALTDPALATLPWVRRPSGGSALVHHHELTYALALPAGLPWQNRGQSWMVRMHGIIARALARVGVTVAPCAREHKRGEVLCFLHHTPGDLVLGQAKVGGSAQRRQRGALLQHGGILLAQSEHTPALPGIRELTGMDLDTEQWRTLLAEQLAEDTGWQLTSTEWTEEELQHIGELVVSRYGNEAWSYKR
jgi:lipoate-protein ligase A